METVPLHNENKNQIVTDKPVVVIEQLCKSFGSNKVLDNFNLSVQKEENVVVLGKSGSGKSVLIKCIIGLLEADSGKIVVLDQNISDLTPDELDKLRSRVGFLFQGNAIYDSMTVRENLEFPLRRRWFNSTQDEINAMVAEALENVGLGHTAAMMPVELSGGMLKRIALARTIIMKPEIMLYDEPTSGLDPVTAREIENLMLHLHSKYHTSSIIISHDMNCVKKTADRIVLLHEGKNYAEGSYKDFKQSEDKNIRQFFE